MKIYLWQKINKYVHQTIIHFIHSANTQTIIHSANAKTINNSTNAQTIIQFIHSGHSFSGNQRQSPSASFSQQNSDSRLFDTAPLLWCRRSWIHSTWHAAWHRLSWSFVSGTCKDIIILTALWNMWSLLSISRHLNVWKKKKKQQCLTKHCR